MLKLLNNKVSHEILAFLAGSILAGLVAFLFLSTYLPNNQETTVDTLTSTSISPNQGVLYNYNEGVSSEIALMSSLKRNDQITLFGSSEFNDQPMVSYNYLPNQYGMATVGFGHAFHQNFSIFCELLAANEYLPESKIVLFISPGWFETEGTNSESFLEFVPPNFLKKIWNDVSISNDLKAEIGRYINENRSNFSGLTKQMQNFQDLYLAERTLSPGKKLKMKLAEVYPNLSPLKKVIFEVNENPLSTKVPHQPIQEIKDSLSRQFIASCSNNKMYIDSNYFKNYLLQADGSSISGSVNEIDVSNNREFADFMLVIELLKARHAEVSVIIQGLNPYYYPNLSVLNPLISSLTGALDKKKIPYLNLFTADTKQYEPGTLSDVMHLGDLGWLRVNEFILKTYSK